MYNEGAPEFIIDQGLYYPTSTNYAYYCTGFESPGELDDHHGIFAVDGQDLQYAGAQTEILPYVYYTPSYDYAQSPYNPYNPYIPGAVIGVDDQFAGTQQFYTIPSYQDTISPSAYYPAVVQSGPEMTPNGFSDPFFDSGAYTAHRPISQGLKPSLSSASAAFTMTTPRPASNQSRFTARVSEVPRANSGSSRPPLTHGTVFPGSFPNPAPLQVIQGRGASGSIQSVDNISNGRALPHHIQSKVAPVNNGFSDFGSSAHRWSGVEKYRPKINHGRALMDVNGSPNLSIDQHRGPRTNKLNNHIAAKPFTSKAGGCNPQEDIIIYTDQYNKDDFQVDYVNAKFFVIKSYSEDDVHKSIKYNVWSSTPNGNKKLDNAFEEAHRIAAGEPRGCPIFMFFSVNASGQFCGMAEMIGTVDFKKDMDFWQQDKWSGSFPVKWHIIKDVSNANFRHIILENNENKPVTNSRDTQEIRYKQGLDMLKIFKKHTSKTSLLDDFMYYENRQKILKEEKSRLLTRRYPLFVPASEPPRKLNPVSEESKITKHTDSLNTENVISPTNPVVSNSCTNGDTKLDKVEAKDKITSPIIFGSLPINEKPDVAKEVGAKPIDVVTVGSMPVKLNGFAGSRLTFGSLPLDPKTKQPNKESCK